MNRAPATRVARRTGRPNTDLDENWYVETSGSRGSPQGPLVHSEFTSELIARQEFGISRPVGHNLSRSLQDVRRRWPFA